MIPIEFKLSSGLLACVVDTLQARFEDLEEQSTEEENKEFRDFIEYLEAREMETEQPEEVEHVSPEDADLLILVAGGAKSGKSVVASFIGKQLSVSAKVDNQAEKVHIKAQHNIFNIIADKRIVIKEMPVVREPILNNLLATELKIK